MSRSDELWNEMKQIERIPNYIEGYVPLETRTNQLARLAAVAAIEALARIEDIDAQIGKRSTK